MGFEEGKREIERISRLSVIRDVCQGRTSGVEENIKNKIVIKVLQALGWDLEKDMDFEHHVQNKRADVALVFNGGPVFIVETKSVEIRLILHKAQALNYAYNKGVQWVLLTNGSKFQLFKSVIYRNPSQKPDSSSAVLVEPRYNQPIFESSLRDLPDRFLTLWNYISKDEFGKIEERTLAIVSRVAKRINEEIFLHQLNAAKLGLFNFLRNQFLQRYETDDSFTKRIDNWIDTNEIDKDWTWKKQYKEDTDFRDYIKYLIETDGLDSKKLIERYSKDSDYALQINQILKRNDIPLEWFDRICSEGAYAFMIRLLFLRMYEDIVLGKRTYTTAARQLLETPNTSSEGTLQALRTAFIEMGEKFGGLYRAPLFDSVLLEDIIWDQPQMIAAIITKTHENDFSAVDRDILGDVYQNHVPKEVRKSIGQFYTDPEIVDYILKRLDDRIGEETTVLDPACGSGTFLVGAYERIKKKMMANGVKEEDVHRHILGDCLYGIDIDPFATQLTVMNLLIKDLYHPERIDHVVTGNSLDVGIDSFTPEGSAFTAVKDGPASEVVTVADLMAIGRKKGYNLIIGNPPHKSISKKNPKYKEAIKTELSGVTGDGAKVHLASLFLKRAIDIVESNGAIALIVPKTFTYSNGYSLLREHIIEKCRIIEITDLGKAWKEVGAEQVIFFLEKRLKKQKNMDDVRIVSGLQLIDSLGSGEFNEHKMSYEEIRGPAYLSADCRPPGFAMYWRNPQSPNSERIWEKVWSVSVPLTNVSDIFRGYTEASISAALANEKRGKTWTPILRGSNIGGKHDVRWFLDLDGVSWVDVSNPLLSDAKMKRLSVTKIVAKQIVSSDVKVDGAVDDSAEKEEIPFLNIDTVQNIVPTTGLDPWYLLGLLHSNLITVYLRDIIYNRATLTMHLDEGYIGRIPLIDKPGKSGKKIADDARKLVRMKQDLEIIGKGIEHITDSIDLQKGIMGLKNTIDEEIYELFGVSKWADEIDSLRKIKLV